MKPLSTEELLGLWEEGRALEATERAVRLCAAVSPGVDLEVVRALPVGRRDAAVARLRQQLFGARAECYVQCPACGEGLEFPLDLTALAPPPPDDGGPGELRAGAWRVAYRLPSSGDLQAIARVGETGAARARLLGRCVSRASREQGEAAASDLPGEVLEALEREMERRDPHGAISLRVRCDACAHDWTLLFDVAAYLWEELDREARRLLREVDVLARAYGWSEGEILQLGRQRRRLYLEMAGAT